MRKTYAHYINGKLIAGEEPASETLCIVKQKTDADRWFVFQNPDSGDPLVLPFRQGNNMAKSLSGKESAEIVVLQV